jgi:hypothetical protein
MTSIEFNERKKLVQFNSFSIIRILNILFFFEQEILACPIDVECPFSTASNNDYLKHIAIDHQKVFHFMTPKMQSAFKMMMPDKQILLSCPGIIYYYFLLNSTYAT